MGKIVKWFAAAALVFLMGPSLAAEAAFSPKKDYDVVIAGGGMGGIAAAIQAARMGASVLVAEPSPWIGGQATAAGVSTMDDRSRLKSGLYLDFISRVISRYNLKGKPVGTCYWDPDTVAFEPALGQRVLLDLVEEARARGRNTLDLLTGASVVAVGTEGDKRLRRVRDVTIRTPFRNFTVGCKVLIDATEYGDALPLAKAEYRVGRSSSPFIDPDAMIQDITWTAVIRKYPGGVPSRLRPSEPLPGYDLARRNYESYVTADGGNFRNVYPIALPVNFITHNVYRGLPDSFTPWPYDASRENWDRVTKTVVNWGNDYPGTYGWEGRRGLPAAYLEDPVLRVQVEREALIKTLHFIYYIQNELGESWSVDEDEYNGLPAVARGLPPEWQEVARHMPPIPYVRESRRVVGEYTLTSAEMLQNSLSYRDGQTSHEFPDAIAIGGYLLDLHGAATDADMEWEFEERAASAQLNRPRGPFQVPMRILIPKGVDGLLAAEKNVSASRLAAGALRLQPICMMTGQAAGALAALSARLGRTPREVHPVQVQRALLDGGVVLSLCKYSDVPPGHPLNGAVQVASLYGLIDPEEPPHALSYNLRDMDNPVLAMAIINGNDTGLFAPDLLVTRAAAAEMVRRAQRAVGRPVSASPDGRESFITRGEFAKLLRDAFDLAPSEGTSPFQGLRHRDESQVEAVNVLGPLGVLDVYAADPEFHFGHPVTRGEAAALLMGAMLAATE